MLLYFLSDMYFHFINPNAHAQYRVMYIYKFCAFLDAKCMFIVGVNGIGLESCTRSDIVRT